MRRTHVGLWEPRQGRTIQERVLTPQALRRICSRRKHDYRVNGGVRRWSTRHASWMRSRPFPTSECGPAAATPSPRRIRPFCIPVIRNACSFFAPSRFSSTDPDTHGDHAEVTSLNYFIIDVVVSAPHLEVNNFTVGERESHEDESQADNSLGGCMFSLRIARDDGPRGTGWTDRAPGAILPVI